MTVGEAWRHPDTGRWMVPCRVENEDDSAVGFSYSELTSDHPQYQDWLDFIERRADQVESAEQTA